MILATSWRSFIKLDINYNLEKELHGFTNIQDLKKPFVQPGLIDCIWFDNKFYYAVGYHSLGYYDPATGENKLSELPKGTAEFGLSLMVDKDSLIWLGYEFGVKLFNKDLKLIKTFKADANDQKTVSGNSVKSIIQDHTGVIYIGTDHGLNAYDKQTGEFKRINTNEGLGENAVNGIFEDRENNLWISGLNTISIISPDRNSVRTFMHSDAFPFRLLGRRFAQDRASQNIYFNSDEGLWQVQPSAIKRSAILTASAGLIDLDINNEAYPMDSPLFLKNYFTLNSNQNHLNFKFGYPQKTSSSTLLARLNGVEKDWKIVPENGQLEYTNINPGSYILEIKVRDKINGVETVKKLISFVIEPPWWQTIWFYMLLALFILSSFWVYTRLRIRSLNGQNKKLEAKVEKRTLQLQSEKKKSDDLLLNILPAEVAEELKLKGEAEAKQYNEVTVLFTDFVNFTGISENLSPKELVGEIHHCFKAIDEIIDRNGLEKIKTIGDAYLAVCGLPNANTSHAIHSVIAAQEIIAFIKKRKREGGIFEIRIGINSGAVVAGIVGIKKYAYDIWGDTVNTAARMEQHSVSGKINISGTTYELIKDNFKCEYRGKIEAKNKGEIDMYFVIA